MEKEEYKLCFVDDNKAWFTNNFEEQWGDDWDDKPYDCNAEDPYDSYKNNGKEYKIKHKIIYFELPNYYGYLPYNRYTNCPYSVKDINNKIVPWIHTRDFNIFAGTSLEEFKEVIKEYNGKIYVRED